MVEIVIQEVVFYVPELEILKMLMLKDEIEMLNVGNQAVEKKGLVEDEKHVRDLNRDCQSRAGDFEVEAQGQPARAQGA